MPGIETAIESPVETAKPLQNLRKEIRKHRRYAALIAALCVFIGVYTHFFRVTGMRYVPWQDGLMEVARVETIAPGESFGGDEHAPEAMEAAPDPKAAPAADRHAAEALVLNVSSLINGFEEHTVVEDDGTATVIMQGGSIHQPSGPEPHSYYESTCYPVPDRLIYGFEEPQKILWGTPLNGGTQILPRLALAYYLMVAAALAGLSGSLWGIFRRWRNGWILRQLFFAPGSYVLSHLLLKGIKTTSFFMEHDLLSILFTALAVYALLSIAWQVFLLRRKA